MPPTADGTDALAVMVSAKIPLQRGRLHARLEEARLRQAQVEARQDALDTAIATELADLAYAARREAETLALFRDRLVPQAQATVESVLAAYTTGEADYAAFLDAERTRFQVQLGLEEALGRYLDATARLERALGGAALADLPTLPLRPHAPMTTTTSRPAPPAAPPERSPYAEPESPRPKRRKAVLVAGALVLFLVAVGLAWTFLRGGSADSVAEAPPAVEGAATGGLAAKDLNGDGIVYQSGMHPWIVEDAPGQCPICGMDLQPVPVSGAPAGTVEIDAGDAAEHRRADGACRGPFDQPRPPRDGRLRGERARPRGRQPQSQRVGRAALRRRRGRPRPRRAAAPRALQPPARLDAGGVPPRPPQPRTAGRRGRRPARRSRPPPTRPLRHQPRPDRAAGVDGRGHADAHDLRARERHRRREARRRGDAGDGGDAADGDRRPLPALAASRRAGAGSRVGRCRHARRRPAREPARHRADGPRGVRLRHARPGDADGHGPRRGPEPRPPDQAGDVRHGDALRRAERGAPDRPERGRDPHGRRGRRDPRARRGAVPPAARHARRGGRGRGPDPRRARRRRDRRHERPVPHRLRGPPRRRRRSDGGRIR